MSVVKVVPKKEYEIIKKYLTSHDTGIVILIPEDIAERNGLKHLDEEDIDYDCGGEADLWVEIVSHDDHYFVREMKAREEESDNIKNGGS